MQPLASNHPVVQEYYACGNSVDPAQCADQLVLLHNANNDVDRWRFALRGARFLELDEAHRAERKKNKGESPPTSKQNFRA